MHLNESREVGHINNFQECQKFQYFFHNKNTIVIYFSNLRQKKYHLTRIFENINKM